MASPGVVWPPLSTYPDNRIDRPALFACNAITRCAGGGLHRIATTLGTGLALGLRCAGPRIPTLDRGAVLLPVVTPDLIIAAAMVALRQVVTALAPGFRAGDRPCHLPGLLRGPGGAGAARRLGVAQEEAARDLYACEARC